MGGPISAAHTARILEHLARTHPDALDGLDGLTPLGDGPRREADFWGAVRRTVGQIAQGTIVAEETGRKGHDLLRSAVDDMCGTPPHREIPWPKRWPHPGVPPNPVDPQAVTPAVQAVAALVFQSYADRIADKSLSGAFGEAADTLLAASLRSS